MDCQLAVSMLMHAFQRRDDGTEALSDTGRGSTLNKNPPVHYVYHIDWSFVFSACITGLFGVLELGFVSSCL